MRFDVHPTTMKQKQGASTRTHPAKSHGSCLCMKDAGCYKKRQSLPQSRNLAVLCYMLAESDSFLQTHSATLTGRTYTPSAA